MKHWIKQTSLLVPLDAPPGATSTLTSLMMSMCRPEVRLLAISPEAKAKAIGQITPLRGKARFTGNVD